ncbi:MAG TPA: flavodoxin family protein [Acidobacteriota bacterium]|nr:flavodoxin family protein [Acidobacteriota bacterium]
MEILALIGSPRKGGNTDILVDKILTGAGENGHSSEKIYLYDCDISACLDCRKCKRRDNNCAIADGMSGIYPKLAAADMIIFGTPVYWYGPTAKMKLLIDRLRPFIASARLTRKKGIVVIPSEEGDSCCGPLIQMFRMSFEYLDMDFAGSILAKAYEKGEIRNNLAELDRAYALGKSM